MDKKLKEVNNILFAVFSSISLLSLSILYIVQAPVAGYIIRESLKLKASDADTVHTFFAALVLFLYK